MTKDREFGAHRKCGAKHMLHQGAWPVDGNLVFNAVSGRATYSGTAASLTKKVLCLLLVQGWQT